MKLLTPILLFYFAFTVNSFAYLDPGTGSIILQAIIAFFAFMGIWWKKIIFKVKELFDKIKPKKIEK